jgi:putative endonuclease
MALHNILGSKGEKIAEAYLAEKGYDIKETNWRKERAEADIIALSEDLLIIAEVKTRTNEYYGPPGDAVGRSKKRMMVKAAELYLQEKQIDLEVRYDVIEIIVMNNSHTIRHIEDAFYPFSTEID